MILISDEDFYSLQNNEGFINFVKNIELNTLLPAKDYDLPRSHIYNVCKFALVGELEYEKLFDYVCIIMKDKELIRTFIKPRTKQEIREFLKTL